MSEPSYTLLLVDDQPDILRILRLTLKDRARKILTTTDPRRALAIIDQEAVDLLIADVDMPEMSGTELCALVRTQFPDVVCMMLTASGSLDAAIKAINEGGVFRYMTKPWQTTDVRAATAAAIHRVDEMRRRAKERAVAGARERYLVDLEAAYPGITADGRKDGVYEIDHARAAAVASTLGPGELGGLLNRPPLPR